jgi:hypothetical protein
MNVHSTRVQLSAISIAIGLMMSPVAHAQSSEGSIYGSGKPGDKVTITSTDNGSSRQLTVDANGTFNAAKLPPGTYRVAGGGVSRDVNVAIGSGTSVSLVADQAAANRVVISRVRSAIDVTSVESNTVFTSDQIAALPVARDINSIAILAPGVVKGDPDLGGGGLPAFAGASVAENGYYINGFDVTNIRNFLAYANLPFDAIGAEQVKSGGYGAEFGRSLGGVISIVTKRGTNTWKGGGALYWSPDSLQSRGKNVENLEPEEQGNYTVFDRANRDRDLSYNVYAGGPLIKDKLFFFGLIEGRNDRSDRFEQNRSTRSESARPNGMIKLDFTPSDQHRFEFTGITNKVRKDVVDFINPTGTQYTTSHSGVPESSTLASGGHTSNFSTPTSRPKIFSLQSQADLSALSVQYHRWFFGALNTSSRSQHLPDTSHADGQPEGFAWTAFLMHAAQYSNTVGAPPTFRQRQLRACSWRWRAAI